MAELAPHPMVMLVALKLAQQSVGTLREDAVKALRQHLPDEVQQLAGAAPAAAAHQVTDAQLAAALRQCGDDKKRELATALANQANLAGLSLFAGFLGGEIDHDAKKWRLLYLDSRLDDWMLVPQDSIIVAQRLRDANAPSGKRDVLWVNSTANVVSGSGPRANDGRFLVGELTRAGDFAPSTSGGTFSVASGLLCEATTPGCCRVTRTRC